MGIFIDALIFFAGLIAGNFLAIGRDKRKEFNKISEKIHFELLKQKESIEEQRSAYKGPNDDDLEKFKRRIYLVSQNKFEETLERYKELTSGDQLQNNGYGLLSYKKPQEVINLIKKLDKYTKRK